ncbi:hypothetical protein PIB30_026319 [Stylosanthes scabra]|uniref:Uncharacterized protein n=1 Tax=Stylosanthes scabra TaxID=79078 RepID=A0ABU6X963_9FABA|nr:hypothetical protein [Stylosanthes scabra]
MLLSAATIRFPAVGAAACGRRSRCRRRKVSRVCVLLTTSLTIFRPPSPLHVANRGLSSRACVSKCGAYSCNELGANWIGCGAVVVWSVAVGLELTVRSLRLEHRKRVAGTGTRIEIEDWISKSSSHCCVGLV